MKTVTSVTVTTVTTTVSLLILSREVQRIITFSQLLSENHIYTIALLNFSMNEDAFDKEKIRHHVQLCDTATVMEITGLSAEEILLLKREKWITDITALKLHSLCPTRPEVPSLCPTRPERAEAPSPGQRPGY